jgi:hypothetical protein
MSLTKVQAEEFISYAETGYNECVAKEPVLPKDVLWWNECKRILRAAAEPQEARPPGFQPVEIKGEPASETLLRDRE